MDDPVPDTVPPAGPHQRTAVATTRSEAAPSAPQSHPWVAGAGLLGAGVVLLVLLVAIGHSDGHWRSAPPAITIDGRGFTLVQGRGHTQGRSFVLDATDNEGLAVLSARVATFRADDYPRVDFDLHSTDLLPVELMFLWRTQERPHRNFSKAMTWTGTRIAPLELGADDGWSGSITGVALVTRGVLPRPLVLESFSAPAVSVPSVIADIVGQWSAFIPIIGASITLPFDEERSHYVPLLVAIACGGFLAAAAYWLLTRRAIPRDPRVYWAILVAGWLMLDARWQINLWRQLSRTAAMYAGKTPDEKRLASDDHELYTLMGEVSAALPAAPVRIHFLADQLGLRTRGSYFLYPQNVYHSTAQHVRPPDPADIRSGDYVLLFLYSEVAYDEATQSLVWRDGRRKPADEILARPAGLTLVRVR
ncbi:MAG: hypothetical protein ACREYB_04945 [Casimicrobiaceae bacterium]